ncbi:hypothetical protein J2Y45_002113 [Dyadobacter sp. BE34]|uniref:Uncharacterized protein n=1 Tax=Dyadobacter fermentans TaxID=94254 RepID=A0ABU1QWN1_9BACT|nr:MULTISPECIES: hypothetical protein [Dyadobacter]MDR6805578.1 hypothetical protein [Dyadobacter fermentans]MDR7042662.1 hypothetical protein [Dyadobacter sp. BE242]MDR7196974.1 hypothetical protein [Dyadobacter sp. BE34]MDR7215591.1 hypothetical protein [Dyadobacter sp. BE31]MDR7263127.1 hypothetical protein [Dyadobacter sp. BE32]
MKNNNIAALVETETPAPATAPQFQFDYASINFSVTGREVSTGEPKAFSFNDSASLNFNDENELNRTLNDKGFLLEVVPALVRRALQSYDSENEKAKQLKQALGALLQ